MKQTFHSNGKLLISGEYVVLDGALALALPTKFGQTLTVEPTDKHERIRWKSLDKDGNVWYEDEFDFGTGKIFSIRDSESSVVELILDAAFREDWPKGQHGYECISQLEFPQDWGLGSSSTLIHNIARWSGTDAYALSEMTLGGSGYDIAAASQSKSFLYKRTNQQPTVRSVDLSWNFTDDLFFVHLNKKQDSRKGILYYKGQNKRLEKELAVTNISNITNALVSARSIETLMELLLEHDLILSKLLEIPTIKEELFSDYPGLIKSLGAWGGDFVMVSGSESDMEYFRRKGFNTIVPFGEMIL